MARYASKMAQDGSRWLNLLSRWLKMAQDAQAFFATHWSHYLISVTHSILACLIGHSGEAKVSKWKQGIQARHSGHNVSIGIPTRHSDEPQYHNRASGRVRHFTYLRYWPT